MPAWQIAFLRFNFYNIMKLHLPTRLRAAVLACFAVVTSFTTTLATGVLSGGAFVVTAAALVAPQASAASFDSITWDGDFFPTAYRFSFVLDDVLVNGSTVAAFWGSSPTVDYGANGFTLVDNGDGTYGLKLDDGKLNNTNIDASTALTSNRGTTFEGLVLQKGVVYTVTADGITGADNGAKATVTAVGTGVSHESGTYKSNMNGSVATHDKVNDAYAVNGSTALVWTGDMAAWKNTLGEVTALSTDKVLYFDASESVSKTADVGGDVSVAGMKLYDNYTINATAAANIAATSGVTVAGGKTMTLSAADSNTSLNTISGDVIGALVVSSGKWALRGTVTTSSLAVNGGSLSLANAILSGSVSNNGSLTLGGTLDVSAAPLGDSAFITGNGIVTVESGMLVELGSDFTPVLNSEYKVFGDGQTLTGWANLTKDSFRKGGLAMGRAEITITEKGFIFMSDGVYTDMTTAGVQNWNYTDAVWNTAQDNSDASIAFAQGDSAVFSANADLTITEERIAAAAVTVNQGAKLTLTGNGNRLDCANIVLIGDLALKDNVLANTSRVSGNGKLYIVGEVMFDDLNRFADYTGNIVVSDGGILKVGSAGGNDVGVLGQDYRTLTERTVTIAQGGTVDINGTADFYHKVIMQAGSTYANLSTGNVGTVKRQLPHLVLEGDATVTANAELGMVGANYAATTLELGNNKLTKTGTSTFYLYNTSVSTGTIDIQAGTLNITGGGSSTNTQFEIGNAATLQITSGTHNSAAISAENGSTLTISGGTFSNATITVRSGNTASSTNATLGATVTVGEGSTFQANGGTYTDTAIVLEDGAIFNYRTAGNHTFKSFNTGASTMSAAGNASYTMTVTEASTSTGLLTKNNLGHLAYNGAVDLQGGLNIIEGSVRFNNTATIGGPVTMSNSTALHVGGSADVKISGTGHSIKGLNTLAGAKTTFESGSAATLTDTTLAAPITNKGNLTLAGTLTADLSQFSFALKNPGEKPTYVDASGISAVSGYLSGERVYTLIENTGTLNETAITSVSAAVTGDYANGKLTVSSVDDTVFHVNINPETGKPDEVIAVALGEGKKYRMNGGTLNVGTDGDNILLTAVGDSGIIKLIADAKVASNAAMQYTGALQVVGTAESQTVLTLGTFTGEAAKSARASISSCASVTLDNGKLAFHAAPEVVKNLTVTQQGGAIHFLDYKNSPTLADATVFAETTNLSGDLTITSIYKYVARFEQLSGTGTLNVSGTGQGELYLNVDSLSGFQGRINLTKGAGTTEVGITTGSTAVNFKGISVTNAMTLNLNVGAATTMTEGLSLNNGATLTANIASGASLTSDLVVTGTNNTFNLSGGNLSGDIRLNDGAALTTALTATGNLEVGNNATLTVAAEKAVTVAGVTELGETGALTKGGAGELNMGTSATLDSLNITGGTVRFQSGTIDSLNITGGTVRFQSGTIGNMMVTGGVAHITGATSTVGSDGTFSSSHNNGFYIKGTGEVNIGDGTNQCVVTATRVEMGDAQTGSGGTLNVKAGSRLIVESEDVMGNYHTTGFILGEWGASSTVNVSGSLLLKEASVMCGDNIGYVNVKNGGLLAAKGFMNNKDNDKICTLNLTLEDGGTLVLGATGIAAKTITTTLGAGTVGIMADSSISKNVTLGSTAGTQFDTALYAWTTETDGTTNIGQGTIGGTLTVSGVLSGSGKLVKTGAGTLKLTAANTYGGGTDLTGGTLEVAAESALGSGALSIIGGTLDVTGNVTLGSTVSTTVTGGSLKASHADGWTLTSASVGGAAVSTDSVGKVTLTDTTITGNIIGNDKLVLSGTVGTTAASTVSAASVGGITLTATEANKLTLNNTTIGSAITNTNNGALVLSGTQNVTLDGANTTHYADEYGSTDFGDNGYKSSQDIYTLVSGTAATEAAGLTWQIDGTTVADSDLTDISFDGKTLTVIQNGDPAGKVYYINSGSVEYKVGAGCSAAEKLQLVGGKLVMSKELDTAVTTGGIVVTGSSTTLELKTELAANKLSMGTGAATVLMGDGTLNLGTDTSLASGISLGTETDAQWTGTVKVIGAALSDANLGALGISGSTIELDDTDGTLKGGTYAAAVKLTNGSELTLGVGNAFNGGLDATNGSVKITGKNSISTLTLADAATLGIDFTGMGLDSLLDMGDEALLTVGTLNAGTAGGALNLSALVSKDLLLTMSNGQSITLADITTNNATLGLLLDDGSSTPAGLLEVTDDSGYLYTYTLSQDTDGHTVVKVSAKLYQSGWKGDENDVWTNTDSIGGLDDNWEDTVGLFAGYGSGTVNIDTAGVDASAKTVMVSATEHTTDYTFEGGALVANKLVVNAGSLTINNEGVETQETVMVSGEGSLTVNTGKTLTVGTDMAVLNEAEFTNKGETTVAGMLSVAKDAALTNSRNLSVEGISAEGATINSTGQLTIGAIGGTIGALTGNGYLNNSGELTIKSDTDLQALTNAGTLAVEGVLNVTATATGGVIKAAAANLGYAKLAELQVTGAVTAKELTVDKATMQSLTADKLASLAGDTVTVTDHASLGTFSVNGVLDVGGHLTVAETVESEGEILAASADLQADATLDTLKVTGDLKATNLAVTNLEAATLNAESLTITGSGTGTVQSGVTLEKFSGSGSFTVQGDLTVNSSIAQGGTVQADNITVAGAAVFADVTTGSLTADAVSLTNGSITTLNTTNLTVHGTASVTDDVSLASLGGTGTLQVGNKLTLTEQITSSAHVAAGILELQATGSTLGSVLADTLTMAEGLTLSMSDALLTVDDFGALNESTVDISLSESVFSALDKEESGLYTIADYLIIDGVASADIFNLTDCAGLDALRAAGREATLSVSKGKLYLSITAAMDENGEEIGLVWDATGGNTTTSTGSDIDTEDGFYKALDYVQQVLVKDDVTFDLSADAVGDSESGNASKPELGLTVRNLRGGGELTIKGNGTDQDVASLFNTDGKVTSDAEAVALTVDASRVNLGLPTGSKGIMDDDLDAESPTLASLSLVNGAQVAVNADTEVLGDTDLADTSALQVAEGSILTTNMLSGTDKASVSGIIRVTKGGVYTGSGEGAEIIATGGSDLRLRTGGRKGMSLLAESGSKVTLDSAGQDGSLKSLRMGGASMARMARMAGAAELNLHNTTTTDKGIVHNTLSLTDTEGNYISNTAVTLSLGLAETARTLGTADAPVVIAGAADVTGSTITVNMLGNGVKNGALDIATDDLTDLKLAQLVTGGTVNGNSVVLTGTPEMQALMAKYYTNARLDKSGAITVDRVTDYYSSTPGLSENAQAGTAMADMALLLVNPQANRSEYKNLAGVLDSLDDAVVSGNSAAVDSLGAAVSGASVAALGAAVAGDVERQLMAIRNRTTTMGVDQTGPNLEMPYFNAWINAEGDFRRMDEDGTAAGYELNSWGGTVGFDVDISPNFTAGLAATAMYGDFTAKSADHAEGDMDTYYLTTFARFAAHRWSHTFVATVGMADTSLKRTVAHANGSYSSEGDTDALSFGFLYEVGYIAAMNESATACLQPVFNVMLSHSSLNGYEETGSDAALTTGDVEMTTVTFGLGARTQAQVGTGTLNRTSLLEGRALVKLRAGDREAEAENALGMIPGASGSVVGAEKSVIGMELGVGLTVPVGSEGGSVFADASLEVGGGYTNINGTVGYRINF